MHRTPYTVYRAPRTAHRPPCTVHRTPFAIYRTPLTVHRIPRTANEYLAPYTVQRITRTAHLTPYNMHRALHTVHRAPHIAHCPELVYRVRCRGAACKLSGALAHTICNVRSCPKSVRTFSIQNLLHVFERLNAIFDHSCSAYVRISALAIEPQFTRHTVHRATRSADRISCTAHRTQPTIHKRCMLSGV